MKTAFVLLFALILGGFSAHGALSAYEALDRLGLRHGSPALDELLLVRGFDGRPDPTVWIVTRRTPDGITPADIIHADGGVTTGSVDLASDGLAEHPEAIRLPMLNMDSGAALRLARRAAKEQRFRFQSVDYELRMDSLAGTPVWTVTLYDETRGRLGRVTFSATTGATLRPLKFSVYEIEDASPLPLVRTEPEPFHERAGRSIVNWFSGLGKLFSGQSMKALSTTEEIVTGERTRDEALEQP